jgi:hypothetical protein
MRKLLVGCLLLILPEMVQADGGTVRWSQRQGDYRITVFTSPTPFRAGPVDVSVLIQDAGGEPIAGVPVRVRMTPRDHPEGEIRQLATTEAATNKLFHAAVFDLPQAGWWDVEIVIEGLQQPLVAHFAIEADEPLPRLGEMTAWIAWPAGAILLFLVHQWLVRRGKQV